MHSLALLDELSEPLHPKVVEIIKSEFALIPSSQSVVEFNDEFLNKHKDSVAHIQSVLRARQDINKDDQEQNEKDLLATLDLPSITMEEAKAGGDLLKWWRSSQADAYNAKAAKKWPESTIFSKN